MITKESTYAKAFEIKKQALKEKQKSRQLLLSAAYSTNDRLSQIDNELSSLGASLAITALSGDENKLESIKAKSQELGKEKEQILKNAQVCDIVYDCPL